MRMDWRIPVVAAIPLSYAIVGKPAFDREVARAREEGVASASPLSTAEHALTFGAQGAAIGLVSAAVFSNLPVAARVALGTVGAGALYGACLLAGRAEARNRINS